MPWITENIFGLGLKISQECLDISRTTGSTIRTKGEEQAETGNQFWRSSCNEWGVNYGSARGSMTHWTMTPPMVWVCRFLWPEVPRLYKPGSLFSMWDRWRVFHYKSVGFLSKASVGFKPDGRIPGYVKNNQNQKQEAASQTSRSMIQLRGSIGAVDHIQPDTAPLHKKHFVELLKILAGRFLVPSVISFCHTGGAVK